ncbi:MAG: hypothetical protein ACJ8FI_12530 [Sphingomicrobium sp.]
MMMPANHCRPEQVQEIFCWLNGALPRSQPLHQVSLSGDAQRTFGNVPIGKAQVRQLHLAMHGNSLRESGLL